MSGTAPAPPCPTAAAGSSGSSRRRPEGCTSHASLYEFPCSIDNENIENSKNLPKIDADRRDVSVAEGAVDELAEEARFAYARVAQEEKLEEVVILHVARNKEVATW